MSMATDETSTGGLPSGTGIVAVTSGVGGLAVAGTDYVAPGGVAGGQTVTGGTAASESLSLRSTAHATKGKVSFGVNAKCWFNGVDDTFAIDSSNSLTTVALQIGGAAPDVNTGVGQIGGADTLGLVAGGVEALRVATTAISLNVDTTVGSGKKLIVDSTTNAANVALQISGDPNTGIERSTDGADTLRIVCGGAELLRFSVPSASSAVQCFGNFVMVSGKRLTMTSGRFLASAGANVAAAGTLTLGADGNFFTITGNTNIDFITTTTWQAGAEITLQFTGTPTVNHNTGSPPGSTAAILLAGAANFSATANDILTLVYNGTNWCEKARTVI